MEECKPDGDIHVCRCRYLEANGGDPPVMVMVEADR